jgi:quinoprotein glucose dehydrogenase
MSGKPRQIWAGALLVACSSLSAAFTVGQQPHTTWTDYLGGADSAQYSALKQINKSNVNRLELRWFYPAGNNGAEFGFNPVVVDGLMYVLGKDGAIAALDATTGKEVWLHEVNSTLVAHRGINYWESKDRSDRRLLFMADNCLQALDARTGKEITSFGVKGRVDLRQGLGRDPKTITLIQSFSPGRVFENLIILGSATGEDYDSPPGDIRAYDVLTGKMIWIFHTIPHPGERGYDTWPKDAWKRIGGVNAWGEISIDEKRGIAYFPLGAPTYDFYGGDRKGANLFADCLLALDARTGKYLWHFQLVHHDLWDYDPTAAPKLISVRHEGTMVDAVAEPTKQGFLFVFDRVTGKPLWPVEERPVPKSDVPGEEASPTQPFPTAPPPFARQKFNADEVNQYIADASERAKWRDIVLSARNEGLFTPPGFRNTIEMPGNSGGANWGASAIDPATGMMYVESKDSPTMLKLEGKPPKVDLDAFGSPESQGRVVYVQHCQMCHGAERNGSSPAVPSLVNAVTRLGAGRIRSIIRVGVPPMPSFASLLPKEVDVLIAFLARPEAADVSKESLAWLARAPRLGTSSPLDSSPVRYWSGYGYMNSTEGLPAINPPWSTLTAYDLNAGTIKWQIPLGEVSALAAKSVRNTGSNWPRGGPVVTAGGLIFAGTRSDRKIRAYDKDTGSMLWEKELPARVDGVPSVFELGGREYLAVCGRDVERTTPDTEIIISPPGKPPVQGYYLFALPDENGQRAGSR